MKRFIVLAFIMLMSGVVFSQTTPPMLGVHFDIVKPSMDTKFREGVKKLKAACEQNKSGFGWTTFRFDDNSYAHTFPLKNYAELDNNPFADLEAKIGGEAVGKLFGEMDLCLVNHYDMVITPLPQFSYLTPGADDHTREFFFWYVFPGKEAEAEAILADWKKLYEAKKSPEGYLVSKVTMGGEMRYSLMSWGKDASDLDTKTAKSHELLGEEAGKLWARTLAITEKYNVQRAWRLPALSYSPPKP
jgi:hypothetical protein